MVELKHITKSFGKTNAITDVSAAIQDGMIFGLVGSNGAGKSTLLRLISGIYKPENGSITLDGISIFETPASKQQICFLSDTVNFFSNATPESMCRYYQLNYPDFDKDYFFKLIQKFNIPARKKTPDFFKRTEKTNFPASWSVHGNQISTL